MFTEERTGDLQDQSVGIQLTQTEIALLEQFSYPWRPEQRTHTRNQAELDNILFYWKSRRRYLWDQWCS